MIYYLKVNTAFYFMVYHFGGNNTHSYPNWLKNAVIYRFKISVIIS